MASVTLKFVNLDNVDLYIRALNKQPTTVKAGETSPNSILTPTGSLQFGSSKGSYNVDTSRLNSAARQSGSQATIYVYSQIPDDVRSDGTFTIYIQSADGSVEYWAGAAGGGGPVNYGQIIMPINISSVTLGKLKSWYDGLTDPVLPPSLKPSVNSTIQVASSVPLIFWIILILFVILVIVLAVYYITRHM
jgi:hypothetical protein